MSDDNKIVSLAQHKLENTPHWSGEVLCISCRHTWIGVAPIGTDWVKCPNCHLHLGHPKFAFGWNAGDTVFHCNCGSEAMIAYYRKGKFKFQCMKCGIDHSEAIVGD